MESTLDLRDGQPKENSIEESPPAKKKKKKKKKLIFSMSEILLFLGIGLVIFFLPRIFSLNAGIWDFRETGQIGDTIGGITGPFIGLISAVLVYKALKAQIKANKIITKQFKKQKDDENYDKRVSHITEELKLLREDINEYSCINNYGSLRITDGVLLYGIDAISYVIRNHKKAMGIRKSEIAAHLMQITFLMERVGTTREYIISQKLESEDNVRLTNILKNTYSRMVPVLVECRATLPEDIMKHYNHLNAVFGLISPVAE